MGREIQTDVQVANMALRTLQVDEIESLNEGSRTANIVREHYHNVLSNCLSQSHWSFATKKVQLHPLAQRPSREYEHAYKLPTDCIEIIDIHGPGAPLDAQYTVIAGNVLCTCAHPPLDIHYIYKPPVAVMPAYFIDYVVHALAEELAPIFGYNVDGQRVLHDRVYGRGGKLGIALRRDQANHPRPTRPRLYDGFAMSRDW